jgi:acetyltransferase-like isoleucine patch superfamily enzyme|nr:acyltransferase [Pedobacter glucosidilyticus]
MINKIIKSNIFIFKTALLNFLTKRNKDKFFRVIVASKLSFSIHKTSRIVVSRDFLFFLAWNKREPFSSFLYMSKNSFIHVRGRFKIYSGARIYINPNAELILGSGYINNNCNISCYKRIEIGENVYISENVSIRDSDNHNILNSTHKAEQPILIHNNVWIGMNVTILKGVVIGEGAIIAAGALVNKNVKPFSMVGGVPAKLIKENVKWS